MSPAFIQMKRNNDTRGRASTPGQVKGLWKGSNLTSRVLPNDLQQSIHVHAQTVTKRFRKGLVSTFGACAHIHQCPAQCEWADFPSLHRGQIHADYIWWIWERLEALSRIFFCLLHPPLAVSLWTQCSRLSFPLIVLPFFCWIPHLGCTLSVF